ncbi:unnamed protein product [Leptidea sinapis]|uniref:SHSP domain-containing protein n=1 Tax=Leptidea sinapis TaxID=189913 RepID=A0A5E4QPL5_9NEOP|nr:unnamed protein product [Leptidea sinapis]
MFMRLIFLSVLLVVVFTFPAQKSNAIIKESDQASEKSLWASTLPLFSIFGQIAESFPNFADIGPQIEVGDEYTKIILKARKYKVEDLEVQIKNDKVILKGSKNTLNGDQDLSSKFLYATSLPVNVDKSQITAKLYSDEYLVVTAPSKGVDGNKNIQDRVVPIVQVQEPFKPEVIVDQASSSNDPDVPVQNIPQVSVVAQNEPQVPVEVQNVPDVPISSENAADGSLVAQSIPSTLVIAENVPKDTVIAQHISDVPVETQNILSTSVEAQNVPEVPVTAQNIPNAAVEAENVPEVPVTAQNIPNAPVIVQIVPKDPLVAQPNEDVQVIPQRVPDVPVVAENSPIVPLIVANEVSTTELPVTEENKTESTSADLPETTASVEEKVSYETTEVFKEVTIDTTPYEANEVSDLEPVTVSNI